MKPDPYHIAQLISKYLCGTITEQEEDVLQHWVAESGANKRLFDRLTDDEQSRKSITFFEDIDVDHAWAQMQRRSKKKTKWPNTIRKMWYAAAVAILFVLVGMWWFHSDSLVGGNDLVEVNQPSDNDVLPGSKKAVLLLSDGRKINLADGQHYVNEQDGTTIANEHGELKYLYHDDAANEMLYNILEVPRAGMFNLTLSDGTKVWINAMSELKFPVQFGKEERKVFLKGEAYFEVSHDEDRPFSVEVNGAHVEVLGTHFNVNSYNDVITTLVEGVVKVTNEQKSVLLKPGQQAHVTTDILVQNANVKKVTAWKNGDFYFKSDHIVEIMEQVSRWYDLSVSYPGSMQSDMGYNGNISRDVNLSQVLDMLSFVTGATFKVEGKEVTVQFE